MGRFGMRSRLRVKHLCIFLSLSSPLAVLPPCSNSGAWAVNGAMQPRNYMNVWEGEARAALLSAFK